MPCQYYDPPEVTARKSKELELLKSGRNNPLILYVHHFQVEEELEKCRVILKGLVVKNLVDRKDLPVESLSLDDTVRIMNDYYESNHEYPSLEVAKDMVKKRAKSRHSSRYEWEIKNDEEQRKGMEENLRKYEEAKNRGEK